MHSQMELDSAPYYDLNCVIYVIEIFFYEKILSNKPWTSLNVYEMPSV